MTPTRIQRKRSKGWQMPEGAVYVGRPTKWGNPFSIELARDFHAGFGQPASGGTPRETAVQWFREWLHGEWSDDRELPNPPTADEIRDELRGKDLACWCRTGACCHADVLIEIANKPAPGEAEE